MALLPWCAEFLALIGVLQALAGWAVTARFAARPRLPRGAEPGITVLKPLYGDEPLLEAALASVCAQDYPAFQVVFGVHRDTDPALAVVRRLQVRFPRMEIDVVVNPAQHGPNRKVGNLINMLPAAKHDVLAIADSDLHVRPDYLASLAAALAQPGTGLVTVLYAGVPATGALAARLGSTQITHVFLPGALLSRALGREDCLGATMVLRRETLERIGGFLALVNHLADDNVLGRLVQGLGMRVRLADTVVGTTVPETSLGALWRHELRWARTIRTLVPGQFAASALQYPLFWALLGVVLAGGAAWSWGVFALAWVVRAVACVGVGSALRTIDSSPSPCGRGMGGGVARSQAPLAARATDRSTPPPIPLPQGEGEESSFPLSKTLAFSCPVWLLPLRDLLSIGVMLASYAGRRVDWRGYSLHADTPPPTRRPEEFSSR